MTSVGREARSLAVVLLDACERVLAGDPSMVLSVVAEPAAFVMKAALAEWRVAHPRRAAKHSRRTWYGKMGLYTARGAGRGEREFKCCFCDASLSTFVGHVTIAPQVDERWRLHTLACACRWLEEHP